MAIRSELNDTSGELLRLRQLLWVHCHSGAGFFDGNCTWWPYSGQAWAASGEDLSGVGESTEGFSGEELAGAADSGVVQGQAVYAESVASVGRQANGELSASAAMFIPGVVTHPCFLATGGRHHTVYTLQEYAHELITSMVIGAAYVGW